MAVKTLKINFQKIFLNSKQSKTFFRELLVSLSSDRGPFFLLQPKLTWLEVLSSNYWFYDINDKISKIFFFNFLDIFVLLVTFELLSQYPNIDRAHGLKKDFQLLTDEVFREKLLL